MAYVGDNFKTDAMGARQAGLCGIWLDRANNNASIALHADISVIHSLDELQDTLVPQNSDLQLEY